MVHDNKALKLCIFPAVGKTILGGEKKYITGTSLSKHTNHS